MNTRKGKQLEMGHRALQFALEHPSTDAGFVSAVGILKLVVDNGDRLVEQANSGTAREHESNAVRDSLRRRIRTVLGHILRIADRAAITKPELALEFVRPAPRAGYAEFIIAAKSILAAARAEQALFITIALGEKMLDDLGADIDEYDAMTESSNTGHNDHVVSRADFRAVASDCIRAVKLVDGLMQSLYASNPEVLAGWASAKNVVGPARRAAADVPEPEPAPEPIPVPAPEPVVTPPVAGGMKLK